MDKTRGRRGNVPDITGQRFGRLLVLGRSDNVGTAAAWDCICDCGNYKLVLGQSLRRRFNKTTSCGCLRKELARRTGSLHPNYKGSKWKNRKGYVYLTRESGGMVLEHIFVMESMLGRRLESNETVHHKNGIKDDNSPENLELWIKNHPPGQRVSDQLAWARELIAKYGHLA